MRGKCITCLRNPANVENGSAFVNMCMNIEHVTQVFARVHVDSFDEVRVTKHLNALVPGIHVAQPGLAGIRGHR